MYSLLIASISKTRSCALITIMPAVMTSSLTQTGPWDDFCLPVWPENGFADANLPSNHASLSCPVYLKPHSCQWLLTFQHYIHMFRPYCKYSQLGWVELDIWAIRGFHCYTQYICTKSPAAHEPEPEPANVFPPAIHSFRLIGKITVILWEEPTLSAQRHWLLAAIRIRGRCRNFKGAIRWSGFVFDLTGLEVRTRQDQMLLRQQLKPFCFLMIKNKT